MKALVLANVFVSQCWLLKDKISKTQIIETLVDTLSKEINVHCQTVPDHRYFGRTELRQRRTSLPHNRHAPFIWTFAMGILEKIAEIEREISRTQKNKGECTAATIRVFS